MCACVAFSGLGALLDDTVQTIAVHRDNVLSEMIQLYGSDATIVHHPVKVEFIGEPGDDLGGLTRDLYTSLWSDVVRHYFIGEAAVVPYIPLHRHAECRSHYVAIGRLLAHTVALLKCIPARLSRCCLMCLALGAEQVSDELLLQDFRYVTRQHSNTCVISITGNICILDLHYCVIIIMSFRDIHIR